jgi:NADP-dependent 3-hydroxy acid dehydrogenase YdfG
MSKAEQNIAKKAIITGASGGLGHAIAAALVKRGFSVINLSRSPGGQDCVNIPTDLTSNASITRALGRIRKKHTDASLLVLCAGVLHWHAAGRNPMASIDNDIAVNLSGMIKIADGVFPFIKKNRGDIVIIGSTSAFRTPVGSSVYCAAKHGVLGYIKALQDECRNEDVRILGIHPGGFKSGFHRKAKTRIDHSTLMDPDELAELIVSLIALPRNMEVSEIIINRKAAAG